MRKRLCLAEVQHALLVVWKEKEIKQVWTVLEDFKMFCFPPQRKPRKLSLIPSKYHGLIVDAVFPKSLSELVRVRYWRPPDQSKIP